MAASRYYAVHNLISSGPKLKSEASCDLEEIARLFLSDTSSNILCTFNPQTNTTLDNHFPADELYVVTPTKTYNLTLILRNKPDFSHIELTDDEINNYYDFVTKKAINEPVDENDNPLPERDIDDYEADSHSSCDDSMDIDMPKRKLPHYHSAHPHLSYAEKLAITLYSGDFYKSINSFLRSHGRVTNVPGFSYEYDHDECAALTLQVKEIVLAMVIASIALNKTCPDNIAIEGQRPKCLFRNERPYQSSPYRFIGESGGMTLMEGFTSTGLTLSSVQDFIFDINKNITILFEYPLSAPSSYGMNISDLAKHPDEKEFLFPPNTQFYFYRNEIENINGNSSDSEYPLINYHAIPTNTIDGTFPFSYSYEESALRLTLMQWIAEENNQTKIDTLYQLAEYMAYQENGEKHMQLSKPYEYAHELKNIRNYSPSILERLFKLKPHAEYVYNNYLKNEYEHFIGADREIALTTDSDDQVFIYRPNHGLAHSIRCALYIPLVIDYFSKFAKNDQFRMYCLGLKENDIEKIQIAMLFYITGRESDISYLEDGNRYMTYRENSYKNFCQYAESNDLLLNVDDFEGMTSRKEFYNESVYSKSVKQHLFNIMLMAHKLDLGRCKISDEYLDEIRKFNDRLVNIYPKQIQSLKRLYRIASDMLVATGDRINAYYTGELFLDDFSEYNAETFFRYSTHVDQCLGRCSQIIAKYNTPLPNPTDCLTDENGSKIISCILYAIERDKLIIVKYLFNNFIDRNFICTNNQILADILNYAINSSDLDMICKISLHYNSSCIPTSKVSKIITGLEDFSFLLCNFSKTHLELVLDALSSDNRIRLNEIASLKETLNKIPPFTRISALNILEKQIKKLIKNKRDLETLINICSSLLLPHDQIPQFIINLKQQDQQVKNAECHLFFSKDSLSNKKENVINKPILPSLSTTTQPTYF